MLAKTEEVQSQLVILGLYILTFVEGACIYMSTVEGDRDVIRMYHQGWRMIMDKEMMPHLSGFADSSRRRLIDELRLRFH